MYKITRPLFLVCETPLHAGSGSDLGIVDLPIQRERHTGFPKIEGSSLKGAIREAFEGVYGAHSFQTITDDIVKIHRTFGYDDGSMSNTQTKALEAKFTNKRGEVKSQFSGSLAISDARLLLFPVKSLKGIFAWVTCPRVVEQLITDLTRAGITPGFDIPTANTTAGKNLYDNSNNIQLEEYIFSGLMPDDNDGNTSKLAEWLANHLFDGAQETYSSHHIKNHLMVLNDDDFKDFTTLSTEVITRTKINNNTGTVQEGALFTEEYLPMESVMYSLIMLRDEFTERNEGRLVASDVERFFVEGLEKNENILQVGANANLGKGIMKTIFVGE